MSMGSHKIEGFCEYWPDGGLLRPKPVANNSIIIIIIIIIIISLAEI